MDQEGPGDDGRTRTLRSYIESRRLRNHIYGPRRTRDVIRNKYTSDLAVTKKPLDYLCDAVAARSYAVCLQRVRSPTSSRFERVRAAQIDHGQKLYRYKRKRSWEFSAVPRANVEIAETNCHVFVRWSRSFLPLADASVEHLLNYRAQ